MSAAIQRTSHAPEQTQAIGRALGSVLQSGDILALTGPLGSGKTQFTKGLAAGLGVPAEEPVVSPTFVLVREYTGRLKLYHIDAYRLNGARDVLALGLDELVAEAGAVVAIEWAEHAREAIPRSACWIDLAHVDSRSRRIRIRWNVPARRAALLAALKLANSR